MNIFYAKGCVCCEIPDDSRIGIVSDNKHAFCHLAVELQNGEVWLLKTRNDGPRTYGYTQRCTWIGEKVTGCDGVLREYKFRPDDGKGMHFAARPDSKTSFRVVEQRLREA